MQSFCRRVLNMAVVFVAPLSPALAAAPESTGQSASNQVVAIDVLLEPDAAMTKFAQGVNQQLRNDYPAGYTLNGPQVAHISLVHRYVRAKDLPAIEAAVATRAAAEKPLAWQLTATGFRYGVWAGVALTTIDVERTAQLKRFQEEIVKAVEPFAIPEGDASAFHTNKELPRIDPEIIDYVAKFVPAASGEKYNPHITAGVAHEDFVKKLAARPFEKISFKAARVSIYQLGNFGTAQKKLWQWPVQ